MTVGMQTALARRKARDNFVSKKLNMLWFPSCSSCNDAPDLRLTPQAG